MSKNIVMQELTDNGYDALYPKTSADQIEGIDSRIWQVGDVRCTAKTDLDDSWLLCNGEGFYYKNYPELGKLTKKRMFSQQIASKTNINAKPFYVNREWVVFTNSNYYIGTDINGEMIEYSITLPSGNIVSITGVEYYNGLWVAFRVEKYDSVNNRYKPIIWTTSDLRGTWTNYRAPQGDYYHRIIFLKHCGNYWFMEEEFTNNSERWYYYTTDPTGGVNAWVSFTVNGRNTNIVDMAYYDGTYVGVGHSNGTSRIMMTMTSPVTGVTVSPYGTSPIDLITCYNGQWVMARDRSIEISETTPPSSWTVGQSIIGRFSDVKCYNGHWILSGVNNRDDILWLSETDDITVKNMTNIFEDQKRYASTIVYKDGEIFVGGMSKKDSVYYSCIWYQINALPLITSDLTYNYIKAKP